MMAPTISQKILLLGGMMMAIALHKACAQPLPGPVLNIAIEKNARKDNILDAMIEISNAGTADFNGYLRLTTPKGLTCISGDSIPVNMVNNGKHYIPAKFLLDNRARAGDATLLAELYDASGRLVTHHSQTYIIPATAQLRLAVNTPVFYLYNPRDSVEVSVTVSNSGNTGRMATIVFSIPGLSGEKNFFDFTGFIERQKDTLFTFRFRPSAKLLAGGPLMVNITGLGGADKELFGNLTVQVVNMTDTRTFQNVYPGSLNIYSQRNSFSSSYRRMGNNIDIFQFTGNASADLPAGFLTLNGNIYALNNLVTVNNTYLTYQLFENRFKAGNISQPLEIPFFGRGAEILLSNRSKSRQLQAGFADDRFNLLDKSAPADNSYGFYATGAFDQQNNLNNYSADYIYQYDWFEKAKHQVLGGEINRSLGKAGELQVRYHEGYSEYPELKRSHFSSALEARHTGSYKTIKTAGNYFYSSPYYPGSRRGVLQLQQTVNKLLSKNTSLYASSFVLNFAPRSYTYPVGIRSNNTRIEAGLSFSNLNGNMLSVGYQYQHELSNALTDLTGSAITAHLSAHRIVTSFNRSSGNRRHSVFATAEEGLVYYPGQEAAGLQLKLNSIYTYRSLSFNAFYQHGSYFLMEWMAAERAGHARHYRKLALSLAFNQSFFDKKLSISSGAGYINDPMTGRAPSAFANIKYAPGSSWFLFFNSSWYRYDLGHSIAGYGAVSAGMAELGFTFHFGTSQKYAGKKGKISALVYYDNNNNNIFDKGDSVAANRQVALNHTVFKTNAAGRITYKAVPFGRYQFEPGSQQGWFNEKKEVQLDKYKANIDIPLYQSGTVSGGISYDVDTRTALQFEPKYSNIAFDIYNASGTMVQRVITDESGIFISFLPKGSYRIVADEKTLPANTFISGENGSSFTVKNGAITHVPTFVIGVKEKKRVIKKFGE